MRSSYWLWAALCSAAIAVGGALSAYSGGVQAPRTDTPTPANTSEAVASQIDGVNQRLRALIPQRASGIKAEASVVTDPNMKLMLEIQAKQEAELREAVRALESSLAALKQGDRPAPQQTHQTGRPDSLAMIALVPAFLGALCTIATLVLGIHRNRREHEEGLLKFEQMRLQIEDLKRKLATTSGSAA